MIKIHNKLNRGFTLVETLVSISIFSMSLLGLMSILSSSITNTTYAKEKMTGAYLAQEGIEYIRNMRDAYVLYPANGTWNTFINKLTPCVSVDNACGFNSLFPSTGPNFIFNCSVDPIGCKLYLNNGNYNDSLGNIADSGFTRKIWMRPINDYEVRIFSNVSWRQGSGNYSLTFSEDLFNWTE